MTGQLRGTRIKNKPLITPKKGFSKKEEELLRLIKNAKIPRKVFGQKYYTISKSSAGLYFHNIVSNIPKGTDAGDRLSDKITLTGVKIVLQIANTAALTPLKMRCIVAATSNPNQTDTTDFFAACGSSNSPRDFIELTAGPPRHLYHIQPLNKQKFPKIYWDEVFDIPIDDVTIKGVNQNIVDIKKYIKFPNVKVRYNTSGVASESVYPNLRFYYFFVDKNGSLTSTVTKDVEYYTYFIPN